MYIIGSKAPTSKNQPSVSTNNGCASVMPLTRTAKSHSHYNGVLVPVSLLQTKKQQKISNAQDQEMEPLSVSRMFDHHTASLAGRINEGAQAAFAAAGRELVNPKGSVVSTATNMHQILPKIGSENSSDLVSDPKIQTMKGKDQQIEGIGPNGMGLAGILQPPRNAYSSAATRGLRLSHNKSGSQINNSGPLDITLVAERRNTGCYQELRAQNFQNQEIGGKLVNPYNAIQSAIRAKNQSSNNQAFTKSASRPQAVSKIPKNMEIRYRKDLQQLRFYQTLNSINQNTGSNTNAVEPPKQKPVSQTSEYQSKPKIRQPKSAKSNQRINQRPAAVSSPSNDVARSAEAEAEAKGVEITQDLDAIKTHIAGAAHYQAGINQGINRQSISLNINDDKTADFQQQRMNSENNLSDVETPMLKKPAGAAVSENQNFGSTRGSNFVFKAINENGVNTKLVPYNQFADTLRFGTDEGGSSPYSRRKSILKQPFVLVSEDRSSSLNGRGSQLESNFVISKAPMHMQQANLTQHARFIYSQLQTVNEATMNVRTLVKGQYNESQVMTAPKMKINRVRTTHYDSSLSTNYQSKVPCAKFMEKGNKPVPFNYEEQEIVIPRTQTVDENGGRVLFTEKSPPRTAPGGIRTMYKPANVLSQKPDNQMMKPLFDQEIQGLNLQNLFSVYGPKSQQQKKRPKNHLNSFINSSNIANSAEKLMPVALTSMEPEAHQQHLIMLKNMLVDGSLQEYLGRSTEKDNIETLVSASQRQDDPIAFVGLGESQERKTITEQDSNDDSSDDDDPIVIRMLDSMLPKNTQTPEELQKLQDNWPTPEQIKKQIERVYYQEFAKQFQEKLDAKEFAAMQCCERLYKKMQIYLKKQVDKSTTSTFNPLFNHLKAQMIERETYFAIEGYHQQAANQIESGEERNIDNDDDEEEEQQKDPGFDVFKHTYVDVEDVASHQRRVNQDLFCFYNLKVDLPKSFFTKLGDAQLVNDFQEQAIREFVLTTWPVLQLRKKIVWKVLYDTKTQYFSCVPIGVDAPVSKCCKMCLNFQFSKTLGGRVICMEQMCIKNPAETFYFGDDVMDRLFKQGLVGSESNPEAHRQSFYPTQSKRSRVSTGFKKAVSQEITRRVQTGNHKHISLQQVVTDPQFQFENHANHRVYPSAQLAELLMQYSGIETKSKNPEYVHFADESQQAAQQSLQSTNLQVVTDAKMEQKYAQIEMQPYSDASHEEMYDPQGRRRVLYQVANDAPGHLDTSLTGSKIVSESMLNSPGMDARNVLCSERANERTTERTNERTNE